MDFISPIINLFLITLVGLLIAFSPMIVIVNVLVVLKASRPILRTLILMAGMALPLVIVALLAAAYLDSGSQITLRGIAEKINLPPLITFLFGAWVALLGYRRWQYSIAHGGPKKSVALIMKHPPEKLSGLFVFAFTKSILSATNVFAILFVANMIISNSIKPPLSVIALLWVILIGLLPFLAILYFYFFRHEQLELLSLEVDKLLKRNVDLAINLGLMGIGAMVAFSGLLHLISR